MQDHASKQYDLDLGSIRSRVLAMGGLVESQIRRAIDALTGEIVDVYGGRADVDNKILRVVSRETFAEDSLRVLRALCVSNLSWF